jgi:hypothetical protein
MVSNDKISLPLLQNNSASHLSICGDAKELSLPKVEKSEETFINNKLNKFEIINEELLKNGDLPTPIKSKQEDKESFSTESDTHDDNSTHSNDDQYQVTFTFN